MMVGIHADVSSAAAEVYAASVALSEFLYLSYMTDKMGFEFPVPLTLKVDNQTAIHFSKGSTKWHRCCDDPSKIMKTDGNTLRCRYGSENGRRGRLGP